MTQSTNPPQTEAEFLIILGVQPNKAKELLMNKRVKSIVEQLQTDLNSPAQLSAGQKKLLYKVIEKASSRTAATRYSNLILAEKIRTETDILNAESVMQKYPEASADELWTYMEQNVPKTDELVRIASEVVAENAGAPRVKVLKELKHHSRLQFVPPREIMALFESMSLSATVEKEVAKETLNAQKVSELLEMATAPMPATRTINQIYQRVTIPEHLRTSKDRKWTRYLEGEMQSMHTPFTNYQKTPEILKEHIKRTKGQVRVRFPPEPNGHLHIGHAKALSINFGYRDFYNGWISLRYDDTNPKAEKTEYYEKIEEMVRWMGYTPDAITCASDYFPRLYECAVELIKRGKAYVCHLSRKDVSERRKETMTSKIASQVKEIGEEEERVISPWRDRSVAENLAEFQKMKDGHYEEGDAVLRMKMDMSSDNPQLWDLVAYRVVKHPHVKTGDQWCIYPSYDFTHCLTDSFEDITHSFCTTEFINSRTSYNWLCDALDLYRPVQWEYSRLSLTGALLSKRYITRAIQEGKFTGWSDPRLSTLEGLRARGVPPQSIRRFVESLGITTCTSEISPHIFESIIREDLNNSSKAVAIFNPLDLILPDKRTVLIDQKDFRAGPNDPSFFRLQRQSTVLLKEVGPVELVSEDLPLQVRPSTRPHSAAIPWLPTDAPTATLEVIRGQETQLFTNARISPEAAKAPAHTYWQFLRIGFFIRLDTPTPHFRLVVPLKAAPLLE
ncbi:glutaminyl-tRNA synthetase [Nematocida homosporus]|uniref:glutaminyl-tRNA synthetase n=1 Tax=Nematocida homosporus TaxID=1912981 RepID=UPI002220F7D1|nr:glutaminyl-tRNA synthetase [Nematocida homosporus]KAI5185257.1 glutaminyl-tRNA synthetase [Nematocida homosporus]